MKGRLYILFGKKAAIYCRLSAGDSYETSSDNSVNQDLKASLTHYAKENGWQIYGIYIDSGAVTTALNQLCQDARAHLFDIVLCDSEYTFTGKSDGEETILHREFPSWGIHFIGLSDLDAKSSSESAKDCVQDSSQDPKYGYRQLRLNQLTNEWCLIELAESARNVMARSKPVLTTASSIPFGYRYDSKNPTHVLKDSAASSIISTVFNMYAEGLSKDEIATCFNFAGVPSPDAYAMGKEFHSIMDGNTDLSWHESDIMNLLTNEFYAGIHTLDISNSTTMITDALWKCVQSRLDHAIHSPVLLPT